MPHTISIVIPVLNEEKNILEAYSAIKQIFSQTAYDFEIVFTDNHSTDGTETIISRLAAGDPRVKYLRFSRNFGYQKSIFTGFLFATGAAAIQLDCDLQDPPELMLAFLKHWERGARIVYGIRKKRQEPRRVEFVRKLFYRFLDAISEYPIPQDVGDFRLIDRSVIEILRQCQDDSPYLRGFFAEIGFDQIGFPYERLERQRGDSKFPMRKMIALGLDGIINHSTVPLRLSTWIGFIMAGVTTLTMTGYAICRLVVGRAWPAGFTTVVLFILLSITLNSFFLGIIGEYLSRIFKSTRRRPMTIVEKALNTSAQTTEVPQSRGLTQ
jgi:dolichol-phosphate mannosyltransferase